MPVIAFLLQVFRTYRRSAYLNKKHELTALNAALSAKIVQQRGEMQDDASTQR